MTAFRFLWSWLLVAPVAMGAVIAASSAIAADTPTAAQLDYSAMEEGAIAPEAQSVVEPIAEVEVPVELAQVSVEQPAPAAAPANTMTTVDSLEQIMEYSSEGNGNSLDQVTSISQLSDVQPTDWAFQALQSLVERYGVIAGYPDGTYRGNRAMTRYEFAAGLNAALDRVNELIAAGLADAVSREDLATLQRLQEEFAAELATLRGRVDALEARTAELEANQFSTTTKLRGETIFNVAGVLDEDEAFDSQITFGYRVRLNFDTSFTGRDTLRTRFQVRDVQSFDSNPIGFSFGGTSDGNFQLDNLYYTFPVGDRAQILIGANGLDVDELVASTISPLDSSTDGSVSNFGFPTQYTLSTGDAGAGAIIQLTDNLSLDFGYTGGEASDPSPGAGLFNGDYSIIGQLTFLSDPVDAALTYVNTYVADGLSVYDFDGPTVANTYGAQVNFKLLPGIEIGGGIAYANSVFIETGSAEAWSYQGTLAFRDLGGEGNLLGILAGVPLYSRDIVPRDDTGFLLEGFYNYQLNDNISITPSVIWITDPFNDDNVDDTIIGALRTSFTF
ncbi:MAG: iron uptake porin [Leptolyngbyaceae cyanobacterium RM1_406_9]|nr:iron uptake porin [Leptolyngbyaceae cyanobacterium RM1_406_9]